MRSSSGTKGGPSAHRLGLAMALIGALLLATLTTIGFGAATVDAKGPTYPGPQTIAGGPAYFGPAPNPFPYCENPTYFDPFPENVNPIGRMAVGDTASVTTDNVEMRLTITAEGNPDTQYPGFFPNGADGNPGDQAKGIELAEGDAATIELSEPLFYSQWIFTDVDQPDEGFTVTPAWTQTGEAAVFASDAAWTFAGTTNQAVQLDDTDGVGHPSQAVEGRVQVDFLGAVDGITMQRTSPSDGQSGFAVGGGCEAAGAAKRVVAGPTWNGTSYVVTYELKVRNNLPSAPTIQAAISDAIGLAGASELTGTPQGIPLQNLSLTDDLSDASFSAIEVTELTNPTGGVELNPSYNGLSDIDLLAAGAQIDAESEETISLTVQYTPDVTAGVWINCAADYRYLNQSEVSGTAAGVPISDTSDDGDQVGPNNDNGSGGADDPTPVDFPCPPAGLDIVKTVVAGPNGTCPNFADGQVGLGDALAVAVGDTVTYCVSVRNGGTSTATGVTIADPQDPATPFVVGDLAGGASATHSYDVVVTSTTPTTNTATATGNGPNGPLDPVDDPALIAIADGRLADIELSHTVLEAEGECAVATKDVDVLIVNEADHPVLWCLEVMNSGNMPLANVTVDANAIGVTDRIVIDGVLLPGDSVIIPVPGLSIPVDGLDSPATVIGDPAEADGTLVTELDPVTDEDEAAVKEVGIELQKTVANGAGASCDQAVEVIEAPKGAPVTWCFAITNTGAETLLVTEVTDDTLDITVAVPGAQQLLAADDTIVVSVDGLSPGQIINVATVTGTPVDDNGTPYRRAPDVQDDDDAAINVDAADMAIVKTVSDPGPVPLTSVLDYTLEVTNNGPGTAVGIVVVDTLPDHMTHETLPADADWTCQATSERSFTCDKATSMAPGESTTLTYKAKIELTAGNSAVLVNTATVDSDTPDTDETNNTDTAQTTTSGGAVIVPRPPVDPPTPPVAPPPPATDPPAETPTEPDEVLGLVITGANTTLLAMASILMMAVGGFAAVSSRRSRRDDELDESTQA